MKKITVFFLLIYFSFAIANNCTCENYSDCLDKYNNALFYENYSMIVCYGYYILSKYNDSINSDEKDSIKTAMSRALERLNKTDLSKKLLKETGFIIENKKQKYTEHFVNQKIKNKQKNYNLILMLIFLLVIIVCFYLLYLEKNKKVLK